MSQGPVRTMSIYTHFHNGTNHAQCRRSAFKNMYEGFGYTVEPLSLYGTILPEWGLISLLKSSYGAILTLLIAQDKKV